MDLRRTAAPTLAFLTTSLLGWADPAASSEEPWGRFRGPNGSGVLEVTGLPAKLDPESNLVWRTDLKPGRSSPVLGGGHLYLTIVDGEELATVAIDPSSGEVVWKRPAPRPRREKFDGRNDPASPSPVVDADVVVVFFPEFGMLAYDHAGKELWRHALEPFTNVYGMGASPILAGDTVLLACDQALGSYLLALDKATGEERWKAERPEAKSGHCTPILRPVEGKTPEALLPGSFFLDAYDVATGEKRWFASGLCFEMKSVPVLANGLVFINGYGSPMNQPGNQITIADFADVVSRKDADGNGKIGKDEMPASRAAAWFDFVDLDVDGFLDATDWAYLQRALASQNGMLAFRPGGKGELGADALAWSYRRAVPQLPSPLVYQDVLYMLADAGGLMTTFRPATGELIERGRVEEAVDNFYASPIAGDGKVYLVSESGIVVVLPGGGSFEPLSVTNLGENVYATPALAEGRVYVRTVTALYAFGI